MKWIIFLSLIFVISLVSAVTCSDSFLSSSNIQVCGYCYESNGSVCLDSRQCNVTIYYPNGTSYIENTSATNNGDGSITYNITQTLDDGNYFGTLNCGVRSKDDFSFEVYTPSPSVGDASSPIGGRPYVLRTELDYEIEEFLKNQEEQNKIPKDIEAYLNYGAEKFSPENIKKGRIILLVIFFITLFSWDIYMLLKKIKLKKKF